MKLKTPQHTQETAKVAEAPVVDLATQLAAHALPDAFRAQAQAPSLRGLATMMPVASGAAAVPDYDKPTVDLGVGPPLPVPPLAGWIGCPPPRAPEVPWREVREHIHQTNPHRGRRDDRNALSPENNDPVSSYRWYGPVTIGFDDPLVRVLPAAHPDDVDVYKQRFLEGSKFPVIAMIWGDTWRTEGQLVMYDGAHRLQAARECGAPIETYIGVRKGAN
jgi:hypothetical protein